MKKKALGLIKKYLLSLGVLLLALSIISHAYIFSYPAKIIAKIFALPVANVILPYKKVNDNTLENEISTTASKTTAKPTEASNSNDDSTKLVSAGEVGGKVISQTIDKSGATDYYKNIYLKNKTGVSIDIKKEYSKKPNLKILTNSDKPQVLIVHTHATECYFPSLVEYYPESWGERDNRISENVVAVGKIIKDTLNKGGIKTVQSEILHDMDEYDGSYDRSRETIKAYLKKYPSIKVVLDIHRDAINQENGDKLRPIVSIKNKTAGQIMLISGCQSGSITGYPNWRKNLRFSLRLQEAIENEYPSLARPLFFAEKKYNQDLCENSVLVEVGSQANLLSEAKYSAELFSKVLVKYLKSFS